MHAIRLIPSENVRVEIAHEVIALLDAGVLSPIREGHLLAQAPPRVSRQSLSQILDAADHAHACVIGSLLVAGYLLGHISAETLNAVKGLRGDATMYGVPDSQEVADALSGLFSAEQLEMMKIAYLRSASPDSLRKVSDVSRVYAAGSFAHWITLPVDRIRAIMMDMILNQGVFCPSRASVTPALIAQVQGA